MSIANRLTRRAAVGCLVACLVFQPSPPRAQELESFTEQIGEYTLIFSTAPAASLPDAVALRHGLPLNSNSMLLNVTVQRDGMNVPAVVSASATNLAQQTREIEMYETEANDLVSYIGVFEIADREVLDFVVDVLPRGEQRPIRLEFREEFLPELPDDRPLR